MITEPNKEQVGVTAPGGFSATASGLMTPTLFVMALIGLAIVYVVHTSVASSNIEHDHLKLEHAEIANTINRLADATEVNNWLMSLPQKERPKLLRPYSAHRYIEDEKPARRTQ